MNDQPDARPRQRPTTFTCDDVDFVRGCVFRFMRGTACPFAPADHEDVVGDTLLAAWGSLPSFDPSRSRSERGFHTWLYKVAFYTVGAWADRVRTRLRHDVGLGNRWPRVEDQIIARDELGLLDGLSPARRDVMLAHASGWAMPEIATAQGVPTSTAWDRLKRGRKALLAIRRQPRARAEGARA